jgi:DNA-binding MarR family transcriptional regulator
MQDSNGINLQDLKENNLSLVIRSIRSDEQCSRVSLVRSTGLKQATITKIVNQLMQWGLVTENESLSNALGRKPIRLALNSDRFLVYAVRINRDYIHAAVYDIAGKCYIRKERSINAADGAHAALNSLKRMLVEAGQGLPTPDGHRRGAARSFDATSTRIALMTSFPGWAKSTLCRNCRNTSPSRFSGARRQLRRACGAMVWQPRRLPQHALCAL